MRLDKIKIFPIKSLDGAALDEVRVTAGGILEHDRVWAIFDEAGRVVNGKRTARVHDLRCKFDAHFKEVCLWQHGQSSREQFALDDPADPLRRALVQADPLEAAIPWQDHICP